MTRANSPWASRSARILAGAHLSFALLLLLAARLFAMMGGGEREGALPGPLLVGFVALTILDYPVIAAFNAFAPRAAGPWLAAATPLVLGTAQWYLVGALIAWLKARSRRTGKQEQEQPPPRAS